MNKPLFLLLSVIALLQACASVSPSASKQQFDDALALKSHQKYANVYIKRDNKITWGGVGMNVFVNNESVGWLNRGSYFHIKLAPATYNIGVRSESAAGNEVEFNHAFNAQEIILIQCSFGYYEDNVLNNIIASEKPPRAMAGKDIDMPCWYEKDLTKIKSIIEDGNLIASSKEIYSPVGHYEYDTAKRQNTVQAYQSFVTSFPESPYAKGAQKKLNQMIESKRNIVWSKLRKQQKCSLRHNDWLYIDKSCNGGEAHGNGRAIYIDTHHSFKGVIKNGQFVSGKYLFDGKVQFDGSFKDAKPDGKGICLYKDEPEECKYYNGKRVDSLFKQRQEIAQLEQRQQKELQEIRGKISELKNRRSQVTDSTGGNELGDMLMDKALDKGIEKVFNRLF